MSHPPVWPLHSVVSSGPHNVDIKGKTYKVIAYQYDMYGTDTYVYIEDGKLGVVVFQDNHDAAQPVHYDLLALVQPALGIIAETRTAVRRP